MSFKIVPAVKLNNTSFNVKHISTIDNKIKIIKYLYDKHKIKYLSLDQFNTIDKIIISDTEYKIFKCIFRSTKSKPITNNDFKIMMIDFLKNLVGKLDIIDSKQNKDKYKKTIYSYFWINDTINKYLDLYFIVVD